MTSQSIAGQTITLASLTGFDWFLLIMLLISTLLAFRRGIIKVLFSLGGLILGIIVASWNYLALATLLHQWISSLAVAQVIAFLLILIVIMLVFGLLAGLVRKTVKAVGLGIFDRLLGAAFGLLRGVLLGVAVLMAIAAFVPNSSWVAHSQLAPQFLAVAHALSFLVPAHFARQIADGATHLLQQSPELFRPHTLNQPM